MAICNIYWIPVALLEYSIRVHVLNTRAGCTGIVWAYIAILPRYYLLHVYCSIQYSSSTRVLECIAIHVCTYTCTGTAVWHNIIIAIWPYWIVYLCFTRSSFWPEYCVLQYWIPVHVYHSSTDTCTGTDTLPGWHSTHVPWCTIMYAHVYGTGIAIPYSVLEYSSSGTQYLPSTRVPVLEYGHRIILLGIDIAIYIYAIVHLKAAFAFFIATCIAIACYWYRYLQYSSTHVYTQVLIYTCTVRTRVYSSTG